MQIITAAVYEDLNELPANDKPNWTHERQSSLFRNLVKKHKVWQEHHALAAGIDMMRKTQRRRLFCTSRTARQFASGRKIVGCRRQSKRKIPTNKRMLKLSDNIGQGRKSMTNLKAIESKTILKTETITADEVATQGSASGELS